MQNLANYYSDSLLSSYLNDSKDTLPTQPDPKGTMASPKRANYTHGAEDNDTSENLPPRLPEIAINPVDALENNFNSTWLNFQTPPSQNQKIQLQKLTTNQNANLRNSMASLATSYNTLYSSVSSDTDDLDLQSVRLQLDKVEEHKKSRIGKFKRLLRRKEPEPEEMDENAKFMAYVFQKLQNNYYFYEKTSTLNIPWEDAVEVFFFGDTLNNLFESLHGLLNYVIQSSLELGEPRFSNLNRFHTGSETNPSDLVVQLVPNLEKFNSVLDLYAESESNIARPELFELFSSFTNLSHGLCLPLAIAMFGRWLLAYNRDSAVESNYQNSLILNYFRKAARMALAVEKVKHFFQYDHLDQNTRLAVNRYFNKDNKNALSISLQSLGEYFQYEHDHNTSVTLWELNCHLTKDLESGNLAILGLTDGYGYGNHIKEHNHMGKRSKTNKFNTKRRIAHLYRILMKQPGFDEYGVSWAEKEKYD